MRRILYFVLSGFMLLLSACVEELCIEDIVANLDTEESSFTYSLQLDALYPHYGGDNTTRATDTGDWEDGDVVYITFSNGESPAIAKVVFSAKTATWTLYSPKRLIDGLSQSCKVMYLCCEDDSNESILVDANNCCVSNVPLSKAFLCNDGKYDVQNDKVIVHARLVPIGKRLRFKGGTPGTMFRVSGDGLHIIKGYGLLDNEVKSNDVFSVDLTIDSDGYSEYMLLSVDISCTEIFLDMYNENDPDYRYFSHYFDGNSLGEGESGNFSVPSPSDLHGWKSEVGKRNHDYVDLDLPSGLKWATTNIGATTPEDYGLFFAWGETIGYSISDEHTFNWSDYKWNSSGSESLSSVKITKYYPFVTSSSGMPDYKTELERIDDAASIIWGYSWRLPTCLEIEELVDNCEWRYTIYNGTYGYIVSSKKNNQKFLFLPAAGSIYWGEHTGSDAYGHYWSSNVESHTSAYYLILQPNNIGAFLRTNGRCMGFSIRPVTD